ncbi:MAG: alpha/beta hydrolase [Paracoccaceae bacterium]
MTGTPDYDSLIDAETWAFIRDTAKYYPEDAVELSIEDQRRVYDEMCRAFHQGYPDGVKVEDLDANGVPVRVYSAGQPTVNVVYYHGGGFVVGGLESHDDVCAELHANTGYRVIAVDYRLAPEHKHPAAFEDSWTATEWVAARYEGDLVLCGDSAGGMLAAGVAHHARGRLDRVVGQVLIYPGVGGDLDAGSFVTHANAPMLTRDDILFYEKVRCDGPPPSGDYTYRPLEDPDFAGLPPTVVYTAECDPIADGGREYVERVREADGRAEWVLEHGLVHGYLRGRTTVTRARDSFERIVLAVEALGQGLWPYG